MAKKEEAKHPVATVVLDDKVMPYYNEVKDSINGAVFGFEPKPRDVLRQALYLAGKALRDGKSGGES